MFYSIVRSVESYSMQINNYSFYNKPNFGQSLLNTMSSKNSSNSPQAVPQNGETRVKHLYANDLHGYMYGFRKLKSAIDEFKAANPDGEVFLSGDDWVGAFEKKNEAILRIMNLMKPTAVTMGNHNFDNKGSLGVSKMLDNATFKTLALNIVPSEEAIKTGSYALQDDIDAGRLAKSEIIEKDGQKFGYIGLVPSDMRARLSQQSQDFAKDMKVLDLKETEAALQKEVDKLEAQGVNKITLISHMGLDADKYIAQNVNGIDIIHGGHSHHILKGLVPGENYFTSKRGEPVIITQAGKNGHNFGELDVVFDNKTGTITKAKNEIKDLSIYPDSLAVRTVENIFLGKPEVIGEIAQDVKALPEAVLKESPLCSFLADGYRKYTGADIVLNNAGTMRLSLSRGPITDRRIIDMMPYYNDVYTFKMSEKDIIDVLNSAVQATRKFNRTGALQVSGMKYTIGKDDKVKDVYLLKDDGSQEKMDWTNPSPNKFYTVAYNSFLAGGSEGVESLKAPEKMIKKFDKTETDILIDYIKSFNGKPILIEPDGRIMHEGE